mmetsp:Transcript_20985/g.53162  ORF Transcript_20985/g.53162 Transcript_20985/m.53162 type:complete len:222 (+) Transcript_20985:928-1593(+)
MARRIQHRPPLWRGRDACLHHSRRACAPEMFAALCAAGHRHADRQLVGARGLADDQLGGVDAAAAALGRHRDLDRHQLAGRATNRAAAAAAHRRWRARPRGRGASRAGPARARVRSARVACREPSRGRARRRRPARQTARHDADPPGGCRPQRTCRSRTLDRRERSAHLPPPRAMPPSTAEKRAAEEIFRAVAHNRITARGGAAGEEEGYCGCVGAASARE